MSSIHTLTMAVIVLCASFALAISADGAAVPIAKLTIPNPTINENLGWSVATDGHRVLLGTRNGTAYLFDPFTQQQLTTLTLPSRGFDTSVALQGNTGVVGTWGDAIVYDFSNLPAVTSKKLVPNDGPFGLFGISVDMSGDSIIVGANDEESKGVFTGAAYLFNRATGAQYAKLSADDAQAYDNFGISVAIDGDLAVVGSSKSMMPNNSAVYLYNAQSNFVGNRQFDKYAVAPTNPGPGTYFGYNVDISGNTIMALEASGRTFLWSAGNEPTPLPMSETQRSAGDGISLENLYAAIGFDEKNVVNFYDATGAFLRTLPAPPDSPDGFGFSVAIGGDLVVVSAPGGAPDESAVYVYRLHDVIVPEPGSITIAMGGILTVLSWPVLSRRRSIGRHHHDQRKRVGSREGFRPL